MVEATNKSPESPPNAAAAGVNSHELPSPRRMDSALLPLRFGRGEGPVSHPLSPPWFGLLLVTMAYAIAAALTWRKWPDALVDYGIQLYLPWRISTGSVLYHDVMYMAGGPLSQYYHALLFKLFGVSLSTLIFSNLAIGLGVLILIYRRFLACSDVWTATTISLGVVLVFAFNQFSNIGNYNFITPYCHDVWHGVALSILAISLLSLWLESGQAQGRFEKGAGTARARSFEWFNNPARGRAVPAPSCSLLEPVLWKTPSLLGAGCCAGLVFMTKPDVFAALMLAFAAAFVLAGAKEGMRSALKSLIWSLSAALMPLIAFLLYFHQFQNWKASLRSVAFAWVPLLNSSVSNQVFYKWCAGLDVPRYNIRMMLIHTLVVCAVVGLCALWFRRKLDTSPRRVLTVSLVALLIALATGIDWVDCGRSLPVLSLTLFLILVAQRSSRLEAWNLKPEAWCFSGAWSLELGAFPLLWSLFAFGVLAKLGLYSRIWHYGFALAMPAFAGAIYLLLWLLPSLLEKYGVQRRPFRVTIWLLLMVGFLRLFIQSQLVYQGKTVSVGRGHDLILAFNEKINPAGPAIQSALDWMEKNAGPDATLAVLPEGAIVNYLSRRVNPTRYLAWNSAELAGFGPGNMLAAFRDHSPDYVMLIHRDASDYGVKFFGQEQKFGLELMQWIGQNYEPVWLIGNEPLRNSLFGIKIFKRAPANRSSRREST